MRWRGSHPSVRDAVFFQIVGAHVGEEGRVRACHVCTRRRCGGGCDVGGRSVSGTFNAGGIRVRAEGNVMLGKEGLIRTQAFGIQICIHPLIHRISISYDWSNPPAGNAERTHPPKTNMYRFLTASARYISLFNPSYLTRNSGAYLSTNRRLYSSVHSTHSKSGFISRHERLHCSNLAGRAVVDQL